MSKSFRHLSDAELLEKARMSFAAAAYLEEIDLRLRERNAALAELYLMVQEGKKFLIAWTHTSTLTKEQKQSLRRRTGRYLRTSSTEVLRRFKVLA